MKDDYFILKNLEFFKILELPILVGISRKSMIYKNLKINPEKALNGTSVLNSIAVLKGNLVFHAYLGIQMILRVELKGNAVLSQC